MVIGSSRVLRGGLVAASAALLAVAVSSGGASAWFQSRKVDDTTACNNTTTFPCLEWRKTDANLSVNLDAHADARIVANHEMGHVEGLDHVIPASPSAIMKQGALTFWHIQNDDRNGIIAIYGAYP